MEEVLCAEDQQNPAVWCCFCRFPLPAVCREHLAKHPMDTEVLQHFHLPLYASSWFETPETRMLYSDWLSSLHASYTRLRATDAQLQRFEEDIEAARRDLLQEFESAVAESKRKVAALRNTLRRELKVALHEVCLHALERWSPANESLAAFMWRADDSQIVRLCLGRGSLRGALRVCVDASLPLLSQFNQHCEDASQPAEELRLQNAALAAENEQLKTQVSALEDSVSELRSEVADAEARLRESRTERKLLTDSLSSLKQKRRGKASLLSRKLKAVESHLAEICAELYEKGVRARYAGRYEESREGLRVAWRLYEEVATAGRERLAAGAEYGAVLGLHLGRLQEAQEAVEHTLQGAAPCNSEEELVLLNLRAALSLHGGRWTDCEHTCINILQVFADTAHRAELYWETLYNYVFACCAQKKYLEAESVFVQWSCESATQDSELAQMLQQCVSGRLAQAKKRYGDAELCFLEAAHRGEVFFPTSVYTATNAFLSGLLYVKMRRKSSALEKFAQAQELFSSHFPGSVYARLNLVATADVLRGDMERLLEAPHLASMKLCKTLGRPEDVEQLRLRASALYHLTSKDAATNACHLALLYEELELREAALESAAKTMWTDNTDSEAAESAEALLARLQKTE